RHLLQRGPASGSGNRDGSDAVCACAFAVRTVLTENKVECLVPTHGTTQAAACLMVVIANIVQPGVLIRHTGGVGGIGVVVVPGLAAKPVGAGAADDGDLGTEPTSIFGGEAVGAHLDFRDGFRLAVEREELILLVYVVDAVECDGVHAGPLP